MISNSRSKTVIIPKKSKFYNSRRLEQVENHKGRTTVTYDEVATIDVKNRYKVRGQSMINLLISRLPEGIDKELLLFVFEGDTKNIIFKDIQKKSESLSITLAEYFNVSQRAIQKALKRLIDEGWIAKLNKNTYILWLLPILIFLIGGAIIAKTFIIRKK